MSKREKNARKRKKVFTVRLDKNRGDVFLQDPNSLTESRITFSSETLRQNVSDTSSLSLTTSEDVENILDSVICYHPKCSFAYNLTQENLKLASLITECVPTRTYQKLAELWNLDPHQTPRKHGNICQIKNVEEENQKLEAFLKNVERDLGIRSEVSEDLQVNAVSVEEHKKQEQRKSNPYLKFLKKIDSMNVGSAAKSNIPKKAQKITDMIINNFLNWYQTLADDNETLIDATTLEELFQVGFELPESKALVIRIKELPTVPDCLAKLRNEPKHATRYALKQFLKDDIKREKLPTKMFAFGRMLPKEYPPMRFKPPRNFVKETWLECPRVRSDLDTMKTIWSGLENLRSTVAFATWLKNHPEIKPPTYLLKKGLLDINYEKWNQMYKGFEVEVTNNEASSKVVDLASEKKPSGTISKTKRSSETYLSGNSF